MGATWVCSSCKRPRTGKSCPDCRVKRPRARAAREQEEFVEPATAAWPGGAGRGPHPVSLLLSALTRHIEAGDFEGRA